MMKLRVTCRVSIMGIGNEWINNNRLQSEVIRSLTHHLLKVIMEIICENYF
jgi:hypothetical protein